MTTVTQTQALAVLRLPLTSTIRGRFPETSETYAAAVANRLDGDVATKVVDDIIAKNSERGLCAASGGYLRAHIQHLRDFGVAIDDVKYSKAIDALIALSDKRLTDLEGNQEWLRGEFNSLKEAVGQHGAAISGLQSDVKDIKEKMVTKDDLQKMKEEIQEEMDDKLDEKLDAVQREFDEKMQKMRLQLAQQAEGPSTSRRRAPRKPSSKKPKAPPTIGCNQHLWCRKRGTMERTRVVDTKDAISLMQNGHFVYFMKGKVPTPWMTPEEFKDFLESKAE